MACAADDASGAARTAPPSIATITSNTPSARATLATEIVKKSPNPINARRSSRNQPILPFARPNNKAAASDNASRRQNITPPNPTEAANNQ
jgi:hypothetical protein